MALTAKQVEEVVFRGSLRGYDREQGAADLDAAIGARIDAAVQQALAGAEG